MRYLTSGESHGKCLNIIIEGFPAGVQIDADFINNELNRRQGGYGRGGRMKIETDKIEILSGVRSKETIGSPICIKIENKDWENWIKYMTPENEKETGKEVFFPRPGHADLPGKIKYNRKDMRDILERASARETATRVVVGAFAKLLLKQFDIEIYSHTIRIGNISIDKTDVTIDQVKKVYTDNDIRCIDDKIKNEMIELVEKIIQDKDTVGGQFEILITGVPVGIGSYINWDKKLDAKLAYQLMGLQSVKAVEIGAGFDAGIKIGSQFHDEIFYNTDKNKYYRKTNNAGGIEGGMSNGEIIRATCTVKPIPTLMKPLSTVDIRTKEIVEAVKERSDVCVVPAASVVGENIAATVIVEEFLTKFGSDNLYDIKESYKNYLQRLEEE